MIKKKKIIEFRHLTVLVLLVSATLFFSCQKDKVPEGIVDEKTMVDILAEMHTADAFFNIMNGYECDTLIGEINYTYNQIFKKHNVSKEDFDKSMDYYSKNPKKFRAMYEKVVLVLNQK